MSMHRQFQNAETELRKLCGRIPEKERATWTQRDYIEEMARSNRSLGKAILTKAGTESFWNKQRVLDIPPRHLNDEETAASIQPPYFERTLVSAVKELTQEWLPVSGSLRPMRLHKAQLHICADYQRSSISQIKVDNIAARLDLISFGALTVGYRDGIYYIVDGQNRWMAAQRRPEITEVNCLVFDSNGVDHEARIFAAINMNRTGVTSCDRYRALVTAKDAVALELEGALRALGIEVVARGAQGANQLSAIQLVYNMACRDMRRCEIILSQVQEITPGSPIHGDLLVALEYLERRIEGGVLNPVLKARMRKLGAHRLMDSITVAKAASSGARQIGVAVLSEVNKGLPEAKKIVLLEV